MFTRLIASVRARGLIALICFLAAPAGARADVPSFTGVGHLADGNSSYARAISADGTVVVGEGDSGSGAEAFRWTRAGGMQGLGNFPGSSYSRARAVSS